MKMKPWKRLIICLAAGALILFLLAKQNQKETETLAYPAFLEAAEKGEIAWVRIGNKDQWEAALQNGKIVFTPNPRAADGKERLLSLGIEVTEEKEIQPALGLILLGTLCVWLFFGRREKGALSFQKYAEVKPDEAVPSVTFDDVAASPETLRSMRDIAAFLKNPECFRRCGARPPRGVMLYGPPGTGKTLLARALAGEAKAPFFAMSGADFVQVYVGVGASRVRELFRKARKAGRGVIFIDEIDAIGKKRDNGNDEREQTLNALLTEMSGFSGGDGIMVIAATNRMDTLDEALLREGRFDRRIEVGLPDQDQRLKILQVHAKNKPLSAQVSLEAWSRRTALFSGAQLETLLNEAAIRAARRSGDTVEEEDMDRAYCSLTVGDEQPRRMTDEEKRVLSYHEAGHALMTHLMLPDRRLSRLTVIPSSRGAAGYAMSEQPDKILYSRGELFAMICAALGGRIAEEMLLGKENVTTGASNDLKKAREIARAMAVEFGMGAADDPKEDEKAILHDAAERTRDCLSAHRETLKSLANALKDRETLRENEIYDILNQ